MNTIQQINNVTLDLIKNYLNRLESLAARHGWAVTESNASGSSCSWYVTLTKPTDEKAVLTDISGDTFENARDMRVRVRLSDHPIAHTFGVHISVDPEGWTMDDLAQFLATARPILGGPDDDGESDFEGLSQIEYSQ